MVNHRIGIALFIFISVSAFAAEITSKQACEAAGGKWGTYGLIQKELCNLPTPNAGKECTDSKQCSVACVAQIPIEQFKKYGFCAGPIYEGQSCQSKIDCGGGAEECNIETEKIPGKGVCYGWTIMAGTCLNPVKDGMINVPLCVD